ncbi:aspartate aminotransferase family protein [Aureimonas fodinaquatilis]|uniref:Aspartate aminotransferase family protein n=1 Tax=Aureimonas fodinaquatilis TaxID=2565783 RepID=A0A5B0E2K1_9HYPH|nr:aspartate aminotransferase family protein [Aureimonas fodinaquatilis]KAA0972181.1 aspartate aminotransferase family protein [Aureimonas fodinaquatilis]
MSQIPNSLHGQDIANILHPYTNAVRHQEVGPIVIERGEGIRVYDDTGKDYIEAMAGLWSVAVGFSEPRLVEAATRQLNALPYYHTFTHKSNEPSIRLAERLVAMSPARLSKVFFTNSGSEANDTVVKLLWYYNNAMGRPERKKIISRRRAYHGITVASGSLTGLPVNQQDFDLPIAGVRHLTCPHFYREGREGETEEAFAKRLADEFEALVLAEGPETIAGFIGEPLMAAGGVVPPPATYWQKMQAVCRKYGIMLVADEVITGFGRLGRTFGSDYYGIDPDIMVVSKQLTSSYQPLAAVLISDELFEGVAANSARIGMFGHGFTTSGHPVATAVALANLDIIEERGLVANAAAMGEILQKGLASYADHPLVGEVRGAGLIGAIELVSDKAGKTPFDPVGKAGRYLFERGHEHGLIIRAIGDTIAFCPPLIITQSDVADMLARFGRALDDTATYLRAGA